ncbi:hypothetical protein IV203_029950 [Nitzschia inconspicua]|uniref:Uncharacterized protein n=1 Tax=Nitzschia inconspicua TaxID=303405 RepID=A0A9K3LRP5_9STRA|nr:hypothetical protein IV203_029950 [Nitzschia inconspicua]
MSVECANTHVRCSDEDSKCLSERLSTPSSSGAESNNKTPPISTTEIDNEKSSREINSQSANLADTLTSTKSYSSEVRDGTGSFSKECVGTSGWISKEPLAILEEKVERNNETTVAVKEQTNHMPTLPSIIINIVNHTPALSVEQKNDDHIITKKQKPQRSILRNDCETLSSTNKSARRGSKRGRVAFTNIQIRKYFMILGDNPSTPIGPPLSLGWEYEVLPTMNITDFESFRLRSRRFQTNHLILSHYRRVEIVQRIGYTQEEVAKVEKEMKKIQTQRKITMAFTPCGKIESAFQSIGRKWRRNVLRRGRD